MMRSFDLLVFPVSTKVADEGTDATDKSLLSSVTMRKVDPNEV